jgi:hypothetical protein
MTEESKLTEATKDAERDEAQQAHVADRAATADEEAAAERGKNASGADADDVGEHFEEMTDIGAHVKGEGEIP